jgi:Zn-dependent protease with chaperone function
MTEQEFEALVARLDQQARRRPAAYRVKVILLAYAGYAYVALVLLVAASLFMATIATAPYLKVLAIKLALIFGGFFWVVAGAMWVRLDPPQGRRITSYGAPELFELVDKLRRSLRAPRFHDVLITEDFNAAVAQTPRLGLLGWYRNTLLIGLPLMKALTRQQLAAVLAHEFGHLAGGHGRLGNWVYRLRFGWARLAQALQQRRSVGSFAFRPFFRWYAPYFSAVSFPLARANEYEADAASARLTSPTAVAAALTSVNVIGTYLEARYWPDLHRKANDMSQPAFAPYAQMGEAIGTDVDADAVCGWLDAAMARKTSVADTHPALVDRLRALGEKPLLALPARGEAADTLIRRETLQSISEEFDRRWRQAIQPAWERRHQEVKVKREELAAFDARVAQGATLSVEERVRRALLTEEVGARNETGLAQFRAVHADAPDNPVVCYALGVRLLRIEDEAGVALIEQAMQRDEEAVLPGAELLRGYFARRGRDELARQWHERWRQRAQLVHEVQTERSDVFQSDVLEPHGLEDAQVAALHARLRAIPDLGKAYLARKRVTHYPERPVLVLAFTVKHWRSRRAQRSGAIQDTMVKEVDFPHQTIIVWMQGDRYGFLRWRLSRPMRIV